MNMQNPLPDDVLNFWATAGPKKWWRKDNAFDAEIRTRFLKTHEKAQKNQLTSWLDRPDDTLALVIVLDQFSRNLFRDNPKAYSQDEQCLKIVHRAIKAGIDRKMRQDIGMFVYLPLMHSEVISDQKLCLVEMQRLGLENEAKYAKIHLDIIEKFGRFPHRNDVLGRETTKDEQAFLKNGGFSG